MIDSSGNLFGTTEQGGTANAGTVFEIVHGSSVITTLAMFNAATGINPFAGLTLDSSGNLFGTTETAGLGGKGTVFEILQGTTVITPLSSFNGANGANPYAGVTLDSSGNLFGTTSAGGANNFGAVFEIPHGTTAITVLGSFTNSVTIGANPRRAVILDSSGNLFGTTVLAGASNNGTVFEIIHGTTVITTLASFNNINGKAPQSALTLDASRNLFGTTSTGGAGSDGTIFEIVHGTTSITTIASFTGANGINPDAPLTLDTSGNLFGTTAGGENGGLGTIFEIVQGATVITTLVVLNNATAPFPSPD